MSDLAASLLESTLLMPAGLAFAELIDREGKVLARVGESQAAERHPIAFEGAVVGWLNAAGDAKALARLVAPVLAHPDRALALAWLGAIAELRATHPHVDWIGTYRLDRGDLVITTQLPIAADHLRMPPDAGICWQAIHSGSSIYVPDAMARPDFVPCEFPTRTSLVVPIKTLDGRVLGEIEVDALVPDAFPAEVRAAVEATASALGGLAVSGRNDR